MSSIASTPKTIPLFESDFQTFLRQQSGIAALIAEPNGTGIAHTPLPTSCPFPALTYHLVSQIRDNTLLNPSGLVRNWLQIDCWATTFPDAATLAEAVRTSLDNFSGAMGTTQVELMFLFSETDYYDDVLLTHRRMMEFYIWFHDV